VLRLGIGRAESNSVIIEDILQNEGWLFMSSWNEKREEGGEYNLRNTLLNFEFLGTKKDLEFLNLTLSVPCSWLIQWMERGKEETMLRRLQEVLTQFQVRICPHWMGHYCSKPRPIRSFFIFWFDNWWWSQNPPPLRKGLTLDQVRICPHFQWLSQ
jgi:hypothetical protein